jgi:hypothetical protein
MKNSKIIRRKVLLSLFSLFFAYANARIEKCQDLSFLADPENTNERTLVTFDIDEVLMTYPDKALNTYYERHLGQIDNPMFYQITFTHPEALVNQDTPQIIQGLQEREIKTIALTSRTIGVIGFIGPTEIYNPDFTFDCLQRLGINFRTSFHDLNHTFLTLPQEPYPLFENGILFANNNPKGAALVSFLTTIVQNFQVTKIIFVDNELRHLQSVEQALQDYESRIEFIGLHHTLEASQLQPVRPIDFEVKDFQIRHFQETGEWLNDAQAQERMPNPDSTLKDLLREIEELKINP